jgi:SPP1 gp7 family putative phage head morphogenesis protein
LGIVGSVLQDGVTRGMGLSFSGADFSTPDGQMLMRITRDVWQFASAKNYQQMRDMTMALVDEKNQLRSFNDFEEIAKGINTKYNRTWLRTEYDHAIGSSTMASRWAEFQTNAKDQPYLTYRTVGDNEVRYEHQLLNGITRKITDDFWRRYFPPNGWRCRCDAEQQSGSAIETQYLPKVGIDPMFDTNLAATGMVFPAGHAYYKGVPTDVMKRAVASLPDNVAYKHVYSDPETGKTVDLHIYHGVAETAKNVDIAKILAANGHDIKLLPIVGKTDDDIRELVYKTKNFVKGKNPDALVDGKIFDFTEANPTQNALKNKVNQKAVKHKDKQADNVVIKIKEGALSDGDINRVLKGQYNNSDKLNEVWIIQNNEIIKKDRSHYFK